MKQGYKNNFLKSLFCKLLFFLWQIKERIIALLGGKTLGARALVIRGNEVLLIRHNYGEPGWYTIGGAINRRESPNQAIIRELYEEAGICCKGEPSLFNVYYSKLRGENYIIFYLVNSFSQEEAHSIEIAESRWFPLQNLPEGISPATKRRIQEYLGLIPRQESW